MNETFHGAPREVKSNSDSNSLDLGLDCSKYILPLLWLLECWFSRKAQSQAVDFKNYCRAGKRMWESDKLKNLKLIVLIESHPFILNKHYSDCCETLVIFQFWKSWVWSSLPVLFAAFMKERVFRHPYSTIMVLFLVINSCNTANISFLKTQKHFKALF